MWGSWYVSDDNDTPLNECNWCRYDEKHLFGVHTYWQCKRCPKTKSFNEIEKIDSIDSRISVHPLPWEKS